MAGLDIRWSDIAGLKRMDNALGRLDSGQRDTVLRRAVNHTGDKSRTVVTRSLAGQTGLPYGVIRKAVKVDRADYRSLQYAMTTTGGDVSLKFFKPRETRSGVSASPFGKRRLFAGSFTKAGRFPNRVTAKGLGGHVYDPDRSVSRWGRPISIVNSGVVIPAEMIKGETLDGFTGLVNRELPGRVAHEIKFLVPGFFD